MRPTFTSISSNVVSFSSGGYLMASAHRGTWRCCPSSSAGEVVDLYHGAVNGEGELPTLAANLLDEAQHLVDAGGSPVQVGHREAQLPQPRQGTGRGGESSLPSTCWTLNTNRLNSRWAVILGSFWRREPAAALRGFLKASPPKAPGARTGGQSSRRTCTPRPAPPKRARAL